MKRITVFMVLASLVAALLGGCAGGQARERDKGKIGLVVDQKQIKADTFQYAVWQGLEDLEEEYDEVELKYLESETEEEYLANFDQLADEGYGMIFGSSFLLVEDMEEAAKLNEDVQYLLLDHTFQGKQPENLTGIDFSSEISAFLVGYIAGNVTETGKVGFIGGVSSLPLDRFEYGYRYGVAYAAQESGQEITVDVTYTDTFEEELAGKNAATDMYRKGCDVIFQAAGQCGLGVIEAAAYMDKWVIGVDVDQYEEAPDNVLTSAMKHADEAVKKAAMDILQGEEIGGKNYLYGLEEGVVGIPRDNPNLMKYYPGLYEKAMGLEQMILEGAIMVPYDRDTFDQLAEQQ